MNTPRATAENSTQPAHFKSHAQENSGQPSTGKMAHTTKMSFKTRVEEPKLVGLFFSASNHF